MNICFKPKISRAWRGIQSSHFLSFLDGSFSTRSALFKFFVTMLNDKNESVQPEPKLLPTIEQERAITRETFMQMLFNHLRFIADCGLPTNFADQVESMNEMYYNLSKE